MDEVRSHGRAPASQPENALYNDTYKLAGPDAADDAADAGDMHDSADAADHPGPTDIVRTGSVSTGLQRVSAADGMAGAGGPTPGGTRGPGEWLGLTLWRQKWVLMTSLALAGAGGVLYVRFGTHYYAATAKLDVQKSVPAVAGALPAPVDREADLTFRRSQRDLIKSDAVIGVAVTKLGKLAIVREAADPAAAIKAAVRTDVDPATGLLGVTGYSPSPKEAEALTNGIVDAYMAYQQTKPKTSTAPDTLKLLDTRRQETEAKLKAAQDALTALETAHGPLAEDRSTGNLRLQGLSEALLQSQKDTIDARTALDAAKRAMGIKADLPPDLADPDLMGAMGPQEVTVLKQEMLQSQTLLHALEQRYLPNHPAIVGMKRQIAQLNRKYLIVLQAECASAQSREEQFQKSYNDEQRRVLDLGQYADEYKRQQDDVDRLRKERDSYVDRIRGLELEVQSGNLTIDVQPAKADAAPALPNPWNTLPIALACGLAGGLMLAGLREWVDDRFRSAGEIKNSLGMPILAVIPGSTTKRSPSVSGQRILLDPGSDAAEAYRSLRTAVQFAAPEGGQTKTLVVTSPATGDGKTTLASNLAIALAQAGKKVCLVDADLRKPMQHDIFGVKNNTGLSMLLAGRCSIDTALQKANVSGLEILPCGPIPSNPTEILNSREFGETMDALADRYDMVVIDSPAVEAVNDTRIIAAQCDATLIVLKAQTAHRRSAERTRNSLLGVGAKIMGLVVNDLPRRTHTAYGQMAGNRRYVPGLTSQEYDILQARSK